MPQFYQVVQKAALHQQDVVNIFWYRRESVGLPTDTDLAELANFWIVTFLPSWKAIFSNEYVVTQLTVQGYRDTWQRHPYLPLIRDVNVVGNINAVSAPPVIAATLSARVEPVIPGGPTNKPVRRGFWSVSGIPDVYFDKTGRMIAAFHTEAAFASVESLVASSFALAAAPEQMLPTKVSRPATNGTRGYGFIRSATFRDVVSTRRSRKVGHGAR